MKCPREIVKQAGFLSDPWGTNKRKKNKEFEEKEFKALDIAQKERTMLTGAVKKQNLHKYLGVLKQIKARDGASPSDTMYSGNDHLAEVLRRYGNPDGRIDTNSGGGSSPVKRPEGGEYAFGYAPNYQKGYWDRLVKNL